jgi:DNA polymerase III subunit epsilon
VHPSSLFHLFYAFGPLQIVHHSPFTLHPSLFRMTDAISLQIPDAEFVVCDVETTGLSAEGNRITEIALVKIADGAIVDRFDTLVNPRQFIPYEITAMTGITNEMVYAAPDAAEVMPRVREFIGDAVFVGHNARFDRSFVDATLRREQMDALENPTLCTVRLARRLTPKSSKKSLGKLAGALGITIKNRHRAAGDTEATALVFLHFIRVLSEEFELHDVAELLSFQNKPVYRVTAPPKNFSRLRATLDELPHASGVYYFLDKRGNVIYVGKAKNLRDRVSSYFYHNIGHTEKIRQLVRGVHDIRWTTTDTELSALLTESREIKKHQPRFNSALKNYRRYPFIRLNLNEILPTISWCYDLEDDGCDYFGPFTSRFAVENALDSIKRLFLLRECEGNIKPLSRESACMYYEIKRCAAPCTELQTEQEYLQEVGSVASFLHGRYDEVMDGLRARMNRHAEQLEFELAADVRDRIAALERIIRQQKIMTRSVRKQDLVILTPARGTMVEMHCIKSGVLAASMLIDQKAVRRKELRDTFAELFFTDQTELFLRSKEDVNEMRIIASWCLTRSEESTVIEVDEFENVNALLEDTVGKLKRI